ncbi:plastocyanin/azurin family copper-binding protein [Halorarius halobius]|uniref:plastocyanin/azurin family copper-binding protein n=1 Tax=Halorarius halobius TaxID=2962671 RepID=UPI0020CC85DF|nr:plastocyanin/azurin family copper-binding protein [Halorarius halobius]
MSADDTSSVSRRGFLRAATGATAASAAAGSAAAQEGNATNTTSTTTSTPGGNETATPGGSGGGGLTKEVIVGPGGDLVFEPETVTVTPGSTVNFVWESDGHNIVVDSQPEGADWGGTEGGASTLYDTGYEYSHTFETLGTYEYACEPHRTAGMLGTVEVVEEISTPAPDAGPPPVPDSARTLGIASVIGMASTLGLAYFLMRYGGDYDQ